MDGVPSTSTPNVVIKHSFLHKLQQKIPTEIIKISFNVKLSLHPIIILYCVLISTIKIE